MQLHEMFPSWDKQTLAGVLSSVGNRVQDAVPLLVSRCTVAADSTANAAKHSNMQGQTKSTMSAAVVGMGCGTSRSTGAQSSVHRTSSKAQCQGTTKAASGPAARTNRNLSLQSPGARTNRNLSLQSPGARTNRNLSLQSPGARTNRNLSLQSPGARTNRNLSLQNPAKRSHVVPSSGSPDTSGSTPRVRLITKPKNSVSSNRSSNPSGPCSQAPSSQISRCELRTSSAGTHSQSSSESYSQTPSARTHCQVPRSDSPSRTPCTGAHSQIPRCDSSSLAPSAGTSATPLDGISPPSSGLMHSALRTGSPTPRNETASPTPRSIAYGPTLRGETVNPTPRGGGYSSPTSRAETISPTPRSGALSPTPRTRGETMSPTPRSGALSPTPRTRGETMSPTPRSGAHGLTPTPRGGTMSTTPRGETMSPTPRSGALSPRTRGETMSPTPRSGAHGLTPTPRGGTLSPTPRSGALSPTPRTMGETMSQTPRSGALSPTPTPRGGTYSPVPGTLVPTLSSSGTQSSSGTYTSSGTYSSTGTQSSSGTYSLTPTSPTPRGGAYSSTLIQRPRSFADRLPTSPTSPASPMSGCTPVSPLVNDESRKTGFDMPPCQPYHGPPVLLARGPYDIIMARRLERRCGKQMLEGELKSASQWHKRAHVHQAASDDQHTGCALDRGLLAADAESPRQRMLSREDTIVEGLELLRKRCSYLALRQREMKDDGNCQFRALAHELFGNQEHHGFVRAEIVSFLRKHEDEYSILFVDDDAWQQFLGAMATPGTWGEEITLRAAVEAFGIRIHVLTSTEENWLLQYSPIAGFKNGSRQVFLTYVAPVHYNTIEPMR